MLDGEMEYGWAGASAWRRSSKGRKFSEPRPASGKASGKASWRGAARRGEAE